MFSAVTNYADFKRNILAVTSITTEEALFVARKEGIFFHGMDPSHVALVLIQWPSNDFESYECDTDVRIGMPMDVLEKITKRMSQKASVEISVNENIMLLKSGSTEFKIKLLEVDPAEQKIPQIPTTVEFTIDAKVLARTIGDVEVTTHYFNLKTDGDKLSFTGKGDDGEVEITTDIVPIFEKEYENNAFASYSIEYIKPFVNNMEGDMTLKFANSKPVILECGHVMFILAPRVE